MCAGAGDVLRAMGYAVQVEDHCQSTVSDHLDSLRLYSGAVGPFVEDLPLSRRDRELYLECDNSRWRRRRSQNFSSCSVGP